MNTNYTNEIQDIAKKSISTVEVVPSGSNTYVMYDDTLELGSVFFAANCIWLANCKRGGSNTLKALAEIVDYLNQK